VTSQPAAPTNAEIAQRAQELKVMYLGLMLTMPMMFDPRLPALQWGLRQVGVGQDEDIPLELGHKPDDEEKLTYSARLVLMLASQLRGKVMAEDLMAASMLVGATRLGDLIHLCGPWPKDQPVIQFARHFRNACAHGDRWNFVNNEPKYDAVCRDTVLDASLHGQRATYVTVSPRRYVEFLDDISNHFVPGLVPPPGRQT
jgi:hypothetical protein